MKILLQKPAAQQQQQVLVLNSILPWVCACERLIPEVNALGKWSLLFLHNPNTAQFHFSLQLQKGIQLKSLLLV